MTKIFMTAMFFVGILLFVASIMMATELDDDKCGNQKVRKLNRGISTLGVILTVSSISFLICQLRCEQCQDEEQSTNIYLIATAVLSVIVLVLGVMIITDLGDTCPKAKKWATILTAMSATTAAFSTGLFGYRVYLEQAGKLLGGPKAQIQVAIPKQEDNGSKHDSEARLLKKEMEEINRLAEIQSEISSAANATRTAHSHRVRAHTLKDPSSTSSPGSTPGFSPGSASISQGPMSAAQSANTNWWPGGS